MGTKILYIYALKGYRGRGSRMSGSRALKMLRKYFCTTWNEKNCYFLYILKNRLFTWARYFKYYFRIVFSTQENHMVESWILISDFHMMSYKRYNFEYIWVFPVLWVYWAYTPGKRRRVSKLIFRSFERTQVPYYSAYKNYCCLFYFDPLVVSQWCKSYT